MMLAIRPDLVDLSKAMSGPQDVFGQDFPFGSLRQAGCYAIPPVTVTRQGIYGDATRASRDVGERILDLVAAETAKVIAELATLPVPKVWQSVQQVPTPEA